MQGNLSCLFCSMANNKATNLLGDFNTLTPSKVRRLAVVDVQGMTCQSCVNNIQDNLRGKDGLYQVIVSLENKEG